MRTLTFEEIKAIDFLDLNNKDYRVLVKYDINHQKELCLRQNYYMHYRWFS